MGQRASLPRQKRSAEPGRCDVLQLAVFPTDLGWFGLAGNGSSVAGLTIGHGSAERAIALLHQAAEVLSIPLDGSRSDWSPELRVRLQQFANGKRVEFRDVKLILPELTAFQRAVIGAARRIPYGKTVSYSELATRAGFPRAARAVGSVMARNCIPILIPCHRVIAAGGRIGGYGAEQGTALKQRMLALEAGEPELGPSASESPATRPRELHPQRWRHGDGAPRGRRGTDP